jgi:branched-chain amino acid transport system ATP-binding protein
MAIDVILLETAGLTKEFRGFGALIGPNGAGKTACFNLLTRFLMPTRGRILSHGREITRARPADVARLGLARFFQISGVFPHLAILENVRIAPQRARGELLRFSRRGSPRCVCGGSGRA